MRWSFLLTIKTQIRRRLPQWMILIREHRRMHGEFPRIIRPVTFGEMILRRNLFDRRPLLSQIADKAAVRSYVEARLGSQVLPQLYHVTARPESIPFDTLPDKFVVKPNHGSGWYQVVTEKSALDRTALIETCFDWLNRSYYKETGEIVYRNIEPRILIEQFIDDGMGASASDYKFFVFRGRVEFIYVVTDRLTNHKRRLYTPAWEKLDVRLESEEVEGDAPRPPHLAEMIEAAETLGRDWDFIRVDLYDTAERLYFGELTLTPGGAGFVFTQSNMTAIWVRFGGGGKGRQRSADCTRLKALCWRKRGEGAMPDISVIIPSRNRLWSLPQCVDSCRSAKVSVEIIVVDDGSTDGTAGWLKCQRDVVTISAEGWGKPWAIAKALSVAKGTFIRFLDSDDWLAPGANEGQFVLGERENADVVVSGYHVYRDQTLVQTFPWHPTDDFVAMQLGEDVTKGSHYSAFLFRRSFAQDIPHRTCFPAADFASRDDRCFVLEVALRKPSIAVYPEPTLCHRHHDRARLQFGSGLRGVGTNMQHLLIYRQILSMLARTGELTPRRRRAAANVLWPLATWIGYFDAQDAADLCDWVFELDPNFVPPVTGLLGICYRNFGFRQTQRLLRLRRMAMNLLRTRRRQVSAPLWSRQ
jgi:hypothetical protein